MAKHRDGSVTKLPWTDHKDTDILTPCKLCSNPALSVTGGKYCMDCYRELLTNVILGRYPVSGPAVIDKLYKFDPENDPRNDEAFEPHG